MPILRHLYHGGDTMLPFLFLFFLLFASIIPPLSNLCRHYLEKRLEKLEAQQAVAAAIEKSEKRED